MKTDAKTVVSVTILLAALFGEALDTRLCANKALTSVIILRHNLHTNSSHELVKKIASPISSWFF